MPHSANKKRRMPCDDVDRGVAESAVVLSIDEASRPERYQDRPSVLARAERLEKQRREHAKFLRRLGIKPPRRPPIVPAEPAESLRVVARRRRVALSSRRRPR